MDTSQGKTLVTEDGGQPAIALLKRRDPFRTQGCIYGDEKCLVKGKQDCTDMGAVYEITCDTCTEPVSQEHTKQSNDPGGQPRKNYIGMTATSVHNRMLGHLAGQKAKNSKCPLWRHDEEAHAGQPQQYTTRVIRKERTLLPLSLTEALYIEKQSPGTTLNSKDERGRAIVTIAKA